MTLAQIVADILSIKYEKRLLIFDNQGFAKCFDYPALLADSSYNVVYYDDIESFRLLYETEIENSKDNWAVLVQDDSYVPYDIRQGFFEVQLSLSKVFPRLDESALRRHITDLDIIGYTYGEVFSVKLSTRDTERFITETVFSTANVEKYLGFRRLELAKRISSGSDKLINYAEWIKIAKVKASLELYAARVGLELDFSFADEAFAQFVMGDYQMLSSQTYCSAPIILPKVLDYILKDKVALVVMDGMSLFDFGVLSRYFEGIEFELQCSYALVPTTTAISRQSLLCGKYPRQLEDPFSLGQEEKGFYQAIMERGYTKKQALYTRGYDVQPSPFTRVIAVIINDIDDIVHSQQQGRLGMYNDISLLAKTGKVQRLVCSLYKQGFSVYLTADHGNTHCKGIGHVRTGVEVETKAKRMLILKDFAEVSQIVTDNTITYPAYYMDKEYKYLICERGKSFDSTNMDVMTHGGIAIDEVIVPFVKIKAVK